MAASTHVESLKRIPACDTCKLRKLKCPRTSIDEVCTRCIDKCIRCTTSLANKPRKQRGGRRIDEARQTFGAAYEPAPSVFANVDTTPIADSNVGQGIDWNLITTWESNLLPTPTSLFSNSSQSTISPPNYHSPSYSASQSYTTEYYRSSPFHPSNLCQQDQNENIEHYSLPVTVRKSSNQDPLFQAFQNFGTNQVLSTSHPSACLSFAGTDAMLATSEISSSLAQHLIQTFFDSGHNLTLLIDWSAFQTAWSAAGRRPDQLENPSLEVLCYSMMSLGARVSPHPLLLGTKEAQLTCDDKGTGKDLTQFGLRREAVCRDFFQKALNVSDEKKITDLTSLESIGASSILWEIALDRQQEGFKPRKYASNIFSQIRSLVDDMDPNTAQQAVEKLFSKGFALNLLLRDTGVAAATGQLPNSTDDDIALFQPDYVEGGPFPSKNELIEAYSSCGNEISKALTLRTILYRHLDMKRMIYKYISSAKALKQKEININKVREVWSIIDRDKEFIDIFKDMVKYSFNTWLYPIMFILRMDCSHNTAIISRIIMERIPFEAREASKARGAVSEIGVDGKPFHISTNDSSELYWIQLAEIEEQSRYRLFVEAMSIVDTIDQVILTTPVFRTVLLLKIIHIDMSTWIKTIVETPIEQLGGPAGFSTERKSAALKTMREMCELMGWSWGEMRDYISEINQATEIKLEDFLVEALPPEALYNWR